MSVRDAPRFIGDGLYKVIPELFTLLHSRSHNPIYTVTLEDHEGNTPDTYVSPAVEQYNKIVKKLATKTAPLEVDKYGYKGVFADLPAEEAMPIVEALFKMRLEASGDNSSPASRVMSDLITAVAPVEVVYDASATAHLLSFPLADLRPARRVLLAVKAATTAVLQTHGTANGSMAIEYMRRLESEVALNPKLLLAAGRVTALESLARLMEASAVKDVSLNELIAQFPERVGMYMTPVNRYMRDVLARALPKMLLDLYKDAIPTRERNTDAIDEALEIMRIQAGFGHDMSSTFTNLVNDMSLDIFADESDASYDYDEHAIETLRRLREYFQKVASDTEDLLCVPFAGLGTVVASRTGLVVLDRETTYVLCRSDVHHAIVVAKETLSQYVAFCFARDQAVADEYYTSTETYHRLLARLPSNYACMAACFQRDVDLVSKRYASRDVYIDNQEYNKLIDERVASFGHASGPLSASRGFWGVTDRTECYVRTRALRNVVMTWFDPAYLVSQTYLVYHMGAKVRDEEMPRYTKALKRVLAASHRTRTGDFPAIIESMLLDAPPDVRDTAMRNGYLADSILDRWRVNGEGASLWEPAAVRVRDKANVVRRVADFKDASEMRSLQPSETREILHFEGRDPVAAAEEHFQNLASGEADGFPTVIVYKPEQKFGSRVVAEEECMRRKGNSVLQNNTVAIANTLPGSLMKASARKLARVEQENTATLAANQEQGEESKQICLMLGIDFTKFGHYIAHELQIETARVLDRYFGTNHFVAHMQSLKTSIMVTSPAGMFVKFTNVQGSDGQGLRNGMWQLMLGALALVVFEDLRAKHNYVIPERQIRLSWFMDDHNFPLPIYVLQLLRGQDSLLEYAKKRSAEMRETIEMTYDNFGVKAEASKATTSTWGYMQTGDVIGPEGIINAVGKSLATALLRPSHVAPGIEELVSVPQSAFAGAMTNRADIGDAYLHMVWACVYQAWSAGMRWDTKSSLRAGFMLGSPRCYGGMGIPPVVTAICDRGVFRQDEMIMSLYHHAHGDGPLAPFARDVMTRDRSKYKRERWAQNPLISGITGQPHTSNPLDRALMTDALNANRHKLASYTQERRESVDRLVEEYEVLPTTVPLALWRNSPASVVEQEVLSVAGSSTAKVMVGRDRLMLYRRAAILDAIAYGRYTMRVGNDVCMRNLWSLQDLQASFRFISYVDAEVQLSHPFRYSLHDLVVELPAYDPVDPSVLRFVRRPKLDGTRSLTAGGGEQSTVPVGGAWVDGPLAAYTASIDTASALVATGGSGEAWEIVESLWHDPGMHFMSQQLIKHFISCPAVAFTPPTHCPGLKGMAFKHVVDFAPLDYAKATVGEQVHCNYYMLEVAALLMAYLCKKPMVAFFVVQSVLWTDPLTEKRAQRVWQGGDRPPGARPGAGTNDAPSVEHVGARVRRAVDASRAVTRSPHAMRLDSATQMNSFVTELLLQADADVMDIGEGLPGGQGASFDADVAATLHTVPLSGMFVNSYSKRAREVMCIVARATYTRAITKDPMLGERIAAHLADPILRRSVTGVTVEATWYKKALPDLRTISSLVRPLKDSGSYDIVIRALTSIAARASHGTHGSDEADLAGMFTRAATYATHWWLVLLAENIHAIRSTVIDFDRANSRTLMRFYGMWSSRYGAQFARASREVECYKATPAWQAFLRGFASGEYDTMLPYAGAYVSALVYGVLTHVFAILSGARSENLYEEQGRRRRAVLLGAYAYYMRFVQKYPVGEEVPMTVNELAEKLTRCNMGQRAQRIRSSLPLVLERLNMFCIDAGVELITLAELSDTTYAVNIELCYKETHLKMSEFPEGSRASTAISTLVAAQIEKNSHWSDHRSAGVVDAPRRRTRRAVQMTRPDEQGNTWLRAVQVPPVGLVSRVTRARIPDHVAHAMSTTAAMYPRGLQEEDADRLSHAEEYGMWSEVIERHALLQSEYTRRNPLREGDHSQLLQDAHSRKREWVTEVRPTGSSAMEVIVGSEAESMWPRAQPITAQVSDRSLTLRIREMRQADMQGDDAAEERWEAIRVATEHAPPDELPGHVVHVPHLDAVGVPVAADVEPPRVRRLLSATSAPVLSAQAQYDQVFEDDGM